MQVFQTQTIMNMPIAEILNILPVSLASIKKDQNAALGRLLYETTASCNINVSTILLNGSIDIHGCDVIVEALITYMVKLNNIEANLKLLRALENKYIDQKPKIRADMIFSIAVFNYIIAHCNIIDHWETLTSLYKRKLGRLKFNFMSENDEVLFIKIYDKFEKKHSAELEMIKQIMQLEEEADSHSRRYVASQIHGYTFVDSDYELKSALEYEKQANSLKEDFIELFYNKRSNTNSN